MYVKHGRLDAMHEVFSNLSVHDSGTWVQIITAYAQSGNNKKAVQIFQEMLQSGLEFTQSTCIGILKAFSNCIETFREGNTLHTHTIIRGYDSNICVITTLISMYAKCGRISEARNVFNTLPKKNVVTWNAMIGGYVNHGDLEETVKLLQGLE